LVPGYLPYEVDTLNTTLCMEMDMNGLFWLVEEKKKRNMTMYSTMISGQLEY